MRRLCFTFMMIALPFGLVGCTQPSQPAASKHHDHDHDHGHASEGPHHGDLIELGNDEYHAELVHDEATHKVDIYLLDGSAKSAVVAADLPGELTLNLLVKGKPTQFKLPAVGGGQYSLADETLCDSLCGKEDCKARLNVTIKAKPFVAQVEARDHDHAKHSP